MAYPNSQPEPAVGALLVGEAGRARHRAAMAGLAGIRLLEDLDPGTCQPVPQGPEGIVAVLTEPEDRAWRVEEALASGWSVLAPAPVVPSVEKARTLQTAVRVGRGCLQVEAPVLHSGWVDRVEKALQGLGVVDYVRLQLSVPRTWLVDRAEGVLESEGLWAPWLLERFLGPMDTVAAHSRALVRNRPAEDLIMAHIEFAGGAEGALEVHALGAHLSPTARLHAYGMEGEVEVVVDLRRARVLGLRQQYRLLRDHLRTAEKNQGADRHGGGLDAAALPQALALATWIRQSARRGRRLPRRERPRC